MHPHLAIDHLFLQRNGWFISVIYYNLNELIYLFWVIVWIVKLLRYCCSAFYGTSDWTRFFLDNVILIYTTFFPVFSRARPGFERLLLLLMRHNNYSHKGKPTPKFGKYYMHSFVESYFGMRWVFIVVHISNLASTVFFLVLIEWENAKELLVFLIGYASSLGPIASIVLRRLFATFLDKYGFFNRLETNCSGQPESICRRGKPLRPAYR